MPRPFHATCSPKQYFVRSIDHKDIRYAVFSTPLLPRPLRPIYFPQFPILEYTQPMFITQCDRPSLTPIRKEPIFVINVSIFIFLDNKLENERFCTEWEMESIPWNLLLIFFVNQNLISCGCSQIFELFSWTPRLSLEICRREKCRLYARNRNPITVSFSR